MFVRIATLVAPIILILLIGCSAREGVFGIKRLETTFVPVENVIGNQFSQETDLLVVIDNSGSMNDYSSKLDELAPQFRDEFSKSAITGETVSNCVAGITSDEYPIYGQSNPSSPLRAGNHGCTDELTESEMDQVFSKVFKPSLGGGRERLLDSLRAFIDFAGDEFFRTGDERPIIVLIGDEPAQDIEYDPVAGMPFDIANNQMNDHYIPCGMVTVQLRDGNLFTYNLIQSFPPDPGNCIEETLVGLLDPREMAEYVDNYFLVRKGGNHTGTTVFAITHQELETLSAAVGGPGETSVFGVNPLVEGFGDEMALRPGGVAKHFDIALANVEDVLATLGGLIKNVNTTIELKWDIDPEEPESLVIYTVFPDGTKTLFPDNYYSFEGNQIFINSAGASLFTDGSFPEGTSFEIDYLPAWLAN